MDTPPLRKPLYLMATRRVAVHHTSGSLGVFEGRICQGRYPLARVGRILATREVDWHGDALFACMKAGVSVVLVDRKGTWHGSVEPPVTTPSPVTELLDELMDDSEWPMVLDNFMRHLRARALTRWMGARGRPGVDDPERTRWIRSYVHGGQPPHDLRYDFRGLLRALVESRLHRDGIRTRYCAQDGSTLDLAAELCNLVYGEIVMSAGTIPVTSSDVQASIRLFHASVEDYGELVERALRQLQRLLLRRARRWH